MMQRRVVVLGGGFAALTAARRLRELDSTMTISIVTPKRDFLYLPSLIWIPGGIRQPEQLQIPLTPFLNRYRIEHRVAEVTGLLPNHHRYRIITSEGELECEGVVIATGGAFLKKLPGIEHAITPCEGVDAAVAIRDRLQAMEGGTIAIGFASNPNEATAMRGGPMFEFALGIDTLLRQQGRRDRFKLIFFSPAPKPGIRLGERAYRGLMEQFQQRQIETHLGHKLVRFTPSSVVTEAGEWSADLILFMPGMTGNHWFNQTTLPRSAGGLVAVNLYGQIEGWPCVYVAGDSGSFPGPDWMPKQAHMADMQAVAAAGNLIAEMEGRSPRLSAPPELMCIVDTQQQGILVWRTEKWSIVLPPMRLMHWVKRIFEWWYLRRYR